MTDWVKAVTVPGAVDGAVLVDGVMRVPSKVLKAALKRMGLKTDAKSLSELYAVDGVWTGVRRVDGKPLRVVEIAVTDAPVTDAATAGVTDEIVTAAPVTDASVTDEAVTDEPKADVTPAPLSSPAADGKTDASGMLPVVSDAPVSDAVVLSPADQALVEQHGLEQVMGPHRKLIWEAPMNASRATRMIAIRLNNPDLFAEGSSTPTGGTAATATEESELEDAGSKTARVLLPNKETVELKNGLAPVSVLEHLPPGTELEGDKPCRIKGRDGVWALHATRARKDGGGIDALVLSPDRSGVLTVDLFTEVELIEQPDDGYQVKVIGNDGQVVDPVTGESDAPAPTPAPASPVALKEIDPAVLKKMPDDAKREGDVLCVVPGHPEQWKLHATRKRPDGGVNALLVATQGNRVVVVDRAAVELLPPPAAAPAKKAKKKAVSTGPEDQLDRAASSIAKKFKGEVVVAA